MEALKTAFNGDVLQSVESLISTSKDSFYFDAHRSDTVQQMDHHWKYSGTVLLCGDTGVGKTSLIKKAQEMLSDDVVSLYIDGKVLLTADDILSYILDALNLSGGPLKTRREAAEKLLQHAELEADLGRYVLLYFDHFDALRDNSQRFFWQLSQLPHSQLKMVFVTDSYYRECLEGFGVADTIPQLVLQPLHPHKIIHHLNERLAPSGLEMHQLLSVKALDQLVATSRGNIAKLEDALQQLITQYQAPKPAKTSLSSTVVGVVALSLILTGGIYYLLVGGSKGAEVAPAASVETLNPLYMDKSFDDSPVEIASQEEIQVLTEETVLVGPDQDEKTDVFTVSSPAVLGEVNDDVPSEREPVNVTTTAPAEITPESLAVPPMLPVTIQLMGVYERPRLEAIIRRYSDQPLDIVETERNGRPWFVLLYGTFANKEAAKRQLGRIPSELRAGEPWIRMRNDIR